MQKIKSHLLLSLIFVVSTLFSFAASAVEKYISDDLSIYLRRGPSSQYAIIGSLNSGEKVSVLEKSNDGSYTRIKDDKGRISWVESALLSDTPSLKEQLPALEEELSILRGKADSVDSDKQSVIDDYTNQLTIANQKIAALENTRQQLERKIKDQESEIENQNNLIDKNRQDLMLTWFTRGGLVAGIGLILGIVLTLILPRRRKKDRWMN